MADKVNVRAGETKGALTAANDSSAEMILLKNMTYTAKFPGEHRGCGGRQGCTGEWGELWGEERVKVLGERRVFMQGIRAQKTPFSPQLGR